MKRWLLSLLTGLLLTGMLAACAGEEGSDATAPNQTEEQGTEETQTEENEETAAITISEDEGEEVHAEEDITFTEGDLLLDVMEENFEVEHDSGFVTSIDGIAPEEDEERAWMYYVNDEMPTVGAAEYELESGDEVIFDLQAWE